MSIKHWLSGDRAGAIVLAVMGVGVVFRGFSYGTGSLSHMGAGFIPVVLGCLLTLVGLVLLLSGARKVAGPVHSVPDLRGGLAILLAVCSFVLLGVYGGLVPATFVSVFCAAMGDRKNTLRSAAAVAAVITLAAVLIFHWGLSMQFPLFTWGG